MNNQISTTLASKTNSNFKLPQTKITSTNSQPDSEQEHNYVFKFQKCHSTQSQIHKNSTKSHNQPKSIFNQIKLNKLENTNWQNQPKVRTYT